MISVASISRLMVRGVILLVRESQDQYPLDIQQGGLLNSLFTDEDMEAQSGLP